MKIGLDVHGVLDVAPKFFAEITQIALENKFEIHLITEKPLTSLDIDFLKKNNFLWTHTFSILDYLKLKDPSISLEKFDIDPALLDTFKSKYCADNSISFHIDDTLNYGEYFSTPFILFDFENKRFDWHFKLLKQGTLFMDTPKNFIKNISKINSDILKNFSS